MSKKSSKKITPGYIADLIHTVSGEMNLFILKAESNSSLSKMKLIVELFPEKYDENGSFQPPEAYGIYEYIEDRFGGKLQSLKGVSSVIKKLNPTSGEETTSSKYQLVTYNEVALFIYYFLRFYTHDDVQGDSLYQINDIDKFIKQTYRHLLMLQVTVEPVK